ncbi:MAG: hypothetical protein V4671_07625 [Armatimonadota bacterium]
MATSPPNPNLESTWSPEPELLENPPRRLEPVTDYPDLNKPNVVVYSGVGGALALLGLIVSIMGMSGRGIVFTLLGMLLIGAGVVLFVLVPQKAKAHEERARNLVMNGRVFGANVLTSQNMTGDSTYGRSVRYQVVMPGGEMVHRDVNADERRLPKRIPGTATVLMDPATGDAELYCALPFRAVARPGTAPRPAPSPVPTPAAASPVFTPPAPAPDPLAGIPTATPQPTSNSGSMGTIGNLGTAPPRERQSQSQTQERSAPKPETPATPTPSPAPNPAPPASDDKLPWE